MSDRIRRAPRDKKNPYFMMHQQTAQDERLSFEARGLLAYLLSKPDDWQLIVADLMRAGHCGRDKVRKILAELEAFRYLEKEQIKDKSGRFSHAEYWVYERPLTENPSTESPSTEKPHLQSIESDKVEKKDSAPVGAGVSDDNGKTSHEKENTRALFTAVAKHIFKTDGEDVNGSGGRIGKISNWLAGKYAGRGENKVGKISHPASPDHVVRFAQWYGAKYPDVSMPRDFAKFVEHWREWATAQRAPKARGVVFTQEELDEMSREMMREKFGIDQ